MKKQLVAALIGVNMSAVAQAATPSMEEMWQLIQQQQSEIAALKSQLNKSNSRITETEVMTEATISAVEKLSLAPTSSATTFGGYGEMHYNNLERDDGAASKDELDFHRFVMFTGHQFSDSVRFFSELEVEHSVAGEGKKGEIELEQAFIEWDFAAHHRAKAGLFLLPIGILNETHEPETFYGTERNNVEKNIIPATWWEGGAAVSGELGSGFSYDAALHSGLYLAPGKYEPRDGRQKVSEAKADDMAFTGRLVYRGIPGLELATSLQYQSDVSQGTHVEAIDGTLFEAHIAWQQDNIQVRGLYARWDFDKAINNASFTLGADEQTGFYIEPSYRVNDQLGLFARYSQWDNLAGDSLNSETEEFNVGLNYWLHQNVVFKFDYQNQDAPGETGFDGFNLGMGYSF